MIRRYGAFMKVIPLLTLLPGLVCAGTIKNNLEGVGPKGKPNPKPWICIQMKDTSNVTVKIAPGEEKTFDKTQTGNDYYAGGSLRIGGCETTDSYLGYIGFNISPTDKKTSFANYSAPTGVHITYDAKNMASDNLGGISGFGTFTPILPYTAKPEEQAQPAKLWEFAGINLSGLEFDNFINPTVVPNLSAEDRKTNFSDLDSTLQFIKAGMNTVRVPISWGYLQLDGAGKGELNLEYYNQFIKPTLQTLTKANVYTIIDLHAYMRYSRYGIEYSGYNPKAQKQPDGTLITDAEAYKSVWSKLLKLIQEDDSINKDYIMLDLMNEPAEMNGHEQDVFTIQSALIKQLRADGFKGYILVEGNYWSGLHSWTTKGKELGLSNAMLFSRANFEKQGITDLSKILINVHQYFDSDYSGTHTNCLQNLDTTGPDGFNLDAFTAWLKENQLKAIVTEFGTGTDEASCTKPLEKFVKYMQDNSAKGTNYGFAGWTVWSTGHGWGDYVLRVKPDSYQMKVLKGAL